MSQQIKVNKAYSKALALQSKHTRQRIAESAKSKARYRNDEPGGFTAEGYRKHPFHKPSWGPYPRIRISKQKRPGSLSDAERDRVHDKLMELTKKDTQYLGGPVKERSVGNVSIRNVLDRLERLHEKRKHYRTKTITLPWIIRFLAKYCLIWEGINYLNIVATCLLTAYFAFFDFYDENVSWYIELMEWMFAADTILRLTVEIWRNKTRATVIVFTAPYTTSQFLLDVLSMAPFNYLFYWSQTSTELSDIGCIELFTVNRFLRVTRCIKFFETLERQRMVNEKLLFFFTFSSYYFAFILFTTCLLIFSVGATPMDYMLLKNMGPTLSKSYLADFQNNKDGYGSSPWDIFVITLSFATAVITTVGYGDVVPNSELEMAICIFCMLFGAIFLNGQFTGELTNFEVEIDGARFDLYYRVREIKKFLTSIKTRAFFNSRVEEYYNYLWTYREGVFDVSIMRALPQTFHEELLFDICKEMFDKSQLFYNLDLSFLRALSKISTIALYNSNMVLCRKGKHACKLFYILQGECQALSKLNPSNPSAIIRAGSIIGETNLIFSFPYTTTVETKTCCQFIILSKIDLFQVIEQFPTEFEIVRSRSLSNINELHKTHQAYGVDPVCWVKARTDLENPSKPNAEKLRRNMRWATGMNQEVVEDVVDDSEEKVIFSTPCSDPSVVKDHLLPYVSCAVPEILNSQIVWIEIFNIFIICIALWYAFFGPYCLVFGESTKIDRYICRTQYFLNQVISLIFIVDVFVEIVGACPVAGCYYKFWDGLHVVSQQPSFYFDVLAAVPLDTFSADDQNILQILGTVFKVLKLRKVIRYLHYLEEVSPLNLFWYRLAQTIIVSLYGIHFISCISYTLACPYVKSQEAVVCSKQSWLGSYETSYEQQHSEPVPTNMKATTLGYDYPYLYSFFYSAATLTSAGFGDFNPQNRMEMLWAIAFMLFGFFLIGYYTSVLTSALSCLVRPRLALEQRLVSLYQFMNHYHLREQMKDRIVEYFVLQHQFRGGVPLDPSTHLMYDAPAYLREDVLYLETHELLDGVPIFSKLESEILIKLSSAMNRFIIPPNTTFVMTGEVRRILYIIKHGSMGVYGENMETPKTLLESTSHFGLRDLLFGEPYHHSYRSLSYVALYSIKRKDFEECLQYEDDFWDLVQREKERIRDVILAMTKLYTEISVKQFVTKDEATRIPSWVVIPPRYPDTAKLVLGQVNTKMIKNVNMINDEYESLFTGFKGVAFLKLFLLRKTVHPAGCFSKFWNSLMSLICCLTVITLMLEAFCYLRMPWFRAFQIMLDWFNYVDIYLKFHWGYYNPHNGMLITHPLKTAMNYVFNGSLVLDIAICAPIELIVWIFRQSSFFGYGKAASWYSRLRWIRFFQFKRIPIVFQITHDIFKHRNTILLFLYITSTLFVCTIVSAIAQFIACPWGANDWEEGDEYRIPICYKDSWVAKKFDEAHKNPAVISGVHRRWVLGLYYVSQVILVIGFGDMITLNKADIILLTFMCVFGFLFMRCVIADMTAAEVDSDEARAVFVENMVVLDQVMAQEKVPKKLVHTVLSHLRYTWNRSRGLQPRELFGELHPVLESELHRNLIGDKLSKVKLFYKFPPTVLSSLCRYMKTLHVIRGDRIMRYGNLEYELCIINQGRVYITDRHLNYICSLNPGESFGESSVIYGLPRRYNAIAATNLEVYVLSASHYENFLGRYPDFRETMIENLFRRKCDYFESILEKKMKKAKLLKPEKKVEMLKTFELRTAIVRDLICHREHREQSGLDSKDVKQLSSNNKLVGFGDLDDNLPLIYFAYHHNPKQRRYHFHIPVFHPNCGLIKRFNNLMSWLCFFTPAIAAYEICFSRDFLNSEASGGTLGSSFIVSKYLHRLSEVIEMVFLFYIASRFVIGYEIKPGLFNKVFFRIFLRYITAFDGLIYDLLGSAPFIVEKILRYFNVATKSLGPFWEPIVSNLYLLRSIRLYQYFKTQLSKKNDLDVSTFRLQITLSVTSFCLMAHMLACLFYKISPCTRPDVTNKTFKFSNLCPAPSDESLLDKTGWTTEFTENKDIKTAKDRLEAWRWWFRSLYWVVTTISTTGFGDVVPTTINEMAVATICIFCGAFVLSLILSQFTSGMASLTKTKREYMYQVLLLSKHLKNIGLSEIRQSHVMMYFLTMWNRCRGVPYHKVFHNLPISMQIEVAYALFGKTLNKVPFFIDAPDQIFIRQLSKRVVHALYIPGIYIHKYGDPGSTLFIVYKGVVSGTEVSGSGDRPPLQTIYNPGDAFGRFPAFFQEGTYKKSYRAECMVEILEVKQSDILHLAKRFPVFKRKVISYIASRYAPRGTNVSIFEKRRRKGIIIGAATEMKMAQEAERHHHYYSAKEKDNTDEDIPNPARILALKNALSKKSKDALNKLSASTNDTRSAYPTPSIATFATTDPSHRSTVQSLAVEPSLQEYWTNLNDMAESKSTPMDLEQRKSKRRSSSGTKKKSSVDGPKVKEEERSYNVYPSKHFSGGDDGANLNEIEMSKSAKSKLSKSKSRGSKESRKSRTKKKSSVSRPKEKKTMSFENRSKHYPEDAKEENLNDTLPSDVIKRKSRRRSNSEAMEIDFTDLPEGNEYSSRYSTRPNTDDTDITEEQMPKRVSESRRSSKPEDNPNEEYESMSPNPSVISILADEYPTRKSVIQSTALRGPQASAPVEILYPPQNLIMSEYFDAKGESLKSEDIGRRTRKSEDPGKHHRHPPIKNEGRGKKPGERKMADDRIPKDNVVQEIIREPEKSQGPGRQSGLARTEEPEPVENLRQKSKDEEVREETFVPGGKKKMSEHRDRKASIGQKVEDNREDGSQETSNKTDDWKPPKVASVKADEKPESYAEHDNSKQVKPEEVEERLKQRTDKREEEPDTVDDESPVKIESEYPKRKSGENKNDQRKSKPVLDLIKPMQGESGLKAKGPAKEKFGKEREDKNSGQPEPKEPAEINKNDIQDYVETRRPAEDDKRHSIQERVGQRQKEQIDTSGESKLKDEVRAERGPRKSKDEERRSQEVLRTKEEPRTERATRLTYDKEQRPQEVVRNMKAEELVPTPGSPKEENRPEMSTNGKKDKSQSDKGPRESKEEDSRPETIPRVDKEEPQSDKPPRVTKEEVSPFETWPRLPSKKDAESEKESKMTSDKEPGPESGPESGPRTSQDGKRRETEPLRQRDQPDSRRQNDDYDNTADRMHQNSEENLRRSQIRKSRRSKDEQRESRRKSSKDDQVPFSDPEERLNPEKRKSKKQRKSGRKEEYPEEEGTFLPFEINDDGRRERSRSRRSSDETGEKHKKRRSKDEQPKPRKTKHNDGREKEFKRVKSKADEIADHPSWQKGWHVGEQNEKPRKKSRDDDDQRNRRRHSKDKEENETAFDGPGFVGDDVNTPEGEVKARRKSKGGEKRKSKRKSKEPEEPSDNAGYQDQSGENGDPKTEKNKQEEQGSSPVDTSKKKDSQDERIKSSEQSAPKANVENQQDNKNRKKTIITEESSLEYILSASENDLNQGGIILKQRQKKSSKDKNESPPRRRRRSSEGADNDDNTGPRRKKRSSSEERNKGKGNQKRGSRDRRRSSGSEKRKNRNSKDSNRRQRRKSSDDSSKRKSSDGNKSPGASPRRLSNGKERKRSGKKSLN